MTPGGPPRWLEWLLLRFLPSRDRETISGDLLEEYREEQLPRAGPVRANLWYLRQSMSFASAWMNGGRHVKQMLVLVSGFIVLAGIWLAVMENILKHSGYSVRAAISLAIAAQGMATLLCIVLGGRALFRSVAAIWAIGTGLLGLWAIGRILSAQHFEGYVLLIGLGMVVQGFLAPVVLLRGRST